jgi:hypothetical protein
VKTIVAGSRSITDIQQLYAAIRASGFKITEVVCGEAAGVDKLGRWWAEHRSIPVTSFPADWDGEGRRAGYLRNVRMANYAEALIALWNGKSPGTRHMIEIAKAKGLKVHVHLVGKVGQ